MSETKRSPAPWRDDGDKIVDADGVIVALVYAEDHREKRWYWECGKGNRRLVAAAPELLEAMEGLMSLSHEFLDSQAAHAACAQQCERVRCAEREEIKRLILAAPEVAR